MNDYKNKNWIQFLFFVNAAALKQQISEFYPQILRTKASHHIYFSYRPIINIKASFLAWNLWIQFGLIREIGKSKEIRGFQVQQQLESFFLVMMK